VRKGTRGIGRLISVLGSLSTSCQNELHGLPHSSASNIRPFGNAVRGMGTVGMATGNIMLYKDYCPDSGFLNVLFPDVQICGDVSDDLRALLHCHAVH
jgi:hypothetical protein